MLIDVLFMAVSGSCFYFVYLMGSCRFYNRLANIPYFD